ncbi:MAG TPA: tryptophan synthase subunit alpha [Candidatus Krumholzibacteria bacterium]|nr:tryptophan synthase subunit alpha [Candidatus Krumholzibacteria bacterium]
MNRLAQTTRALRARGRSGLVAFLTAGYPDERSFVAMVRAAVDAGADVVEIGVPFSDPIADGPVIQASSSVALAHGMSLRRALALASELAATVDVPLVVMSYVNPLLAMGTDAFARAAAEAGVAGVILPDVPFEESGAFRTPIREARLDYVDLIAPTSGDTRIRAIAGAAEGFVYVVSLTGVTGAHHAFAADLGALTGRVRAATETPVYVGFGISEPGQARTVARHADGVIIGSRLLELAADGAPGGADGRVGAFLASVRGALDREGR